MASQKRLVDLDWDCLVVLDACRYDTFEKLYSDFLEGELEKRTSPASRTPEWFKNEFGEEEHDDIVYISANPHINSVTSSQGIKASESFHKVYDAWKECWDEKKGTALPDKVTEMALEAIKDHPDKRFVVHYIQPHYPYLDKRLDVNWVNPDNEYNIPRKVIRYLTFTLLGDHLNRVLGRTRAWKVRNALRLPPADGPDEKVWRQMHNKRGEWIQLYEDNLRHALEAVETLADGYDGTICVTGDHGEAFGEHGVFLHPEEADIPELREVPLLEVEE